METQEKYEVATRPSPQDALALQKVADGLFKSGLFPNAKNVYGAFAITQYGHELGIGPMMALKNINLISGQLAANGQLMLSLAMAKGTTFRVLTETDQEVSIEFVRGANKYTATFTKKDAELAGLLGKDNWKKYPKDMLYWRAVAKGVRRVAPDAVMGLYTPDEITNGEIILTEQAPVEAEVVEVKEQPQFETEISKLPKAKQEQAKKRLVEYLKTKPENPTWDDFISWVTNPNTPDPKPEPEQERHDTGQLIDCPNGGQKRIEYCREICTSREGCPAMEGK